MKIACGVPAHADICLHAPSGAGCFLTQASRDVRLAKKGLNAPSGAGRFLTVESTLTAGLNFES